MRRTERTMPWKISAAIRRNRFTCAADSRLHTPFNTLLSGVVQAKAYEILPIETSIQILDRVIEHHLRVLLGVRSQRAIDLWRPPFFLESENYWLLIRCRLLKRFHHFATEEENSPLLVIPRLDERQFDLHRMLATLRFRRDCLIEFRFGFFIQPGQAYRRLRHLSKFAEGQIDEPHLVQAAWNILCLLDTVLRIRDGKLPTSLRDLPFDEIALFSGNMKRE